MKCKKCGGKAVIKLRAHNISLCRDHFLEFFLNRVKKAIKDFRMVKKGERILVAVSGGKDSLSLWDSLIKLGYETEGFYINLGIEGYSDRGEEKVKRFSRERGVPVHIVKVEEFLGSTIPQASKKLRRIPCSICGLAKRYIMNTFALEKGFNVIATGHNLDDEAGTLLGNILKGQWGYLSRQYPVLPQEEGFAKRIKPLVYVTERETNAYAILSGIDYHAEDCPHSKGATSIVQKEALNLLEKHSPGTKQRFLTSFFKEGRRFFREAGRKEEVNPCKNCGYPTTQEICSFCKIKEKLSPGG